MKSPVSWTIEPAVNDGFILELWPPSAVSLACKLKVNQYKDLNDGYFLMLVSMMILSFNSDRQKAALLYFN